MREYDMNILEEIRNCPVEWKELGEVAFLKRGKAITSKTATDGPYPVISGGQKPAYLHGDFNREGETITVAGSGAYAGFVMYWNEPIFVSDAFSIKPFDRILSSKFLYYYLLEIQGILFSLKKGSGVPHVYPKDVSRIFIPLPPLEIQEKIVQILDKLTDYVTELTSELTSRKKQYSFYRDKLLSFEDEVYQVEWKVFKDVATLKNGKDWKVLSSGEIPVYGSGGEMGEFVSDYSYDKPTVLIPRKGSISNLFYLEKAFWNVDTIYYTEIDDKQIIPKYFYYYLTTVKLEEMATNPTRPSLTQAILDKIRIPVPSLEIQSRIIQVLDNFDTVCNDLNIGLPKEIELRQKQYEYFRDKLLTFVAEGEYTESRVEEWDNSAIIKLLQWVFGPIRVKLGAVAEYSQKRISVTDLTSETYVGVDNLLQDRKGKTVATFLPEQGSVTTYNQGDILIGNIRPYLKKIWFSNQVGGTSGDVLTIQNSITPCMGNKYLYYILSDDRFFYYNVQYSKGSKMPRGDKQAIMQYKFILPSFTEQERVVSILDNFNTLTNSLSEGLPKEIELRQKQYEYWREQLLNFTR